MNLIQCDLDQLTQAGCSKNVIINIFFSNVLNTLVVLRLTYFLNLTLSLYEVIICKNRLGCYTISNLYLQLWHRHLSNILKMTEKHRYVIIDFNDYSHCEPIRNRMKYECICKCIKKSLKDQAKQQHIRKPLSKSPKLAQVQSNGYFCPGAWFWKVYWIAKCP